MSKQTRPKNLYDSEDGYGTDDTDSVPILSLVKSTRSKVKMEKRIDDKVDKDSKRYTTRIAASSRSNKTPVEKSSTTKYARSSKRILIATTIVSPI